jgi:hypothetical protein
MSFLSNFVTGFKATEQRQKKYDTKTLSVGDPSFKKGIAKEGITMRDTPVQFLGAYSARLVTDITNDGTRTLWWRANHPNALADMAASAALGKEAAAKLGPLKTGLVMTAALAPAMASSGAYDLLNVGEVGRPKGFAQTYAAEGSEDRRETEQPIQEAFERFFLGRTGKPLAYEEAKKDIPDLTPERYGNFLRSYYQDRGFLGVAKATPENLQGVPEARLLGYPITIPSALGVAGGAAALGIAARTTKQPKATRLGLAGLAGSLGGILTGNIINEAVAAGNRPQLPTTAEYGVLGTDRI